jgi:hypothetical protein
VNKFLSLLAVVLAISSHGLLDKRSEATGMPEPAISVAMTSDAHIADVVGLQEAGGAGPWLEKCCAPGGPCVPDTGIGLVNGITQCAGGVAPNWCGNNNGAACYMLTGTKKQDSVCVEPPPESIIVPNCRARPGRRKCVDYRRGTCENTVIWPLPPQGFCSCELDGSPKDSFDGRKLCDLGSVWCSTVTPATPN